MSSLSVKARTEGEWEILTCPSETVGKAEGANLGGGKAGRKEGAGRDWGKRKNRGQKKTHPTNWGKSWGFKGWRSGLGIGRKLQWNPNKG